METKRIFYVTQFIQICLCHQYKKIETFYMFLVPQSLTLACIFHGLHVSIWTSHISGAPLPHGSGWCIGLCHSRALEGWIHYL